MSQNAPIFAVYALIAAWAVFASLRWQHWYRKWQRADRAARYYALKSQFPILLFPGTPGPRGETGPQGEEGPPAVEPQGENVIPVDFGRKPKPDEPKPL